MKICIVGLGSIGKRHIGNLITIMKKRNIQYRIDALRSNCNKLEEKWENIIQEQFFHINDMPDDYDIVFITNPTSLHYETIKKLVKKTDHMFIEKPLFDTFKYDLDLLNLKSDSIYYVACPLRHKSIMKYIKKEIIEKEAVISARIISTSYLPAWRKDTDYRAVYSSKKKLGGGVTKDLIHEWDYAIYLFGIPEKVFHLSGHLSSLDIDSDDISIYMAQYRNRFLEIHLDYIGQKTERILQLFTNKQRIDIDLIQNVIYEYENDKLVNKREFGQEDFYMNEMQYFLECVEGKQLNVNTVENAYQTLKIAMIGEN